MRKWTDEQLQAIKLIGNNIIVSAGAGSGKTAVLTERVCEHIRRGYQINELLILTFTKDAAQVMKDRIRKALKKENKTDQLNLLDTAYITTFDSFALSLVKRYHYVLNISKKIEITDESIINVATRKIIDEIFYERFLNKDEKFLNLVNLYALKNLKALKEMIYDFNKAFDKYVDKKEKLNSYVESHFNEQDYLDKISQYNNLISELIIDIEKLGEELKVESSDNIAEIISPWLEQLKLAKTLDDKINSLSIEIPRKGKGCGENYSKISKEIKEKINKALALAKRNEEVLRFELDNLKEVVEVIISLLLELDEKIVNYKKKNNFYTFYDIAKSAINLVKDNRDIQNELKNEFKEIMIDEYQDTSDIQEELINLISTNNVYMVGDVKQSIYRFRNANPDLFKSKYYSYEYFKKGEKPTGWKIDLTKNFRSREEVINVINDIFSQVMNNSFGGVDYIKGHKMVQGKDAYNLSPDKINYEVELINYSEITSNYEKEEKEAFIIGNDILKKMEYLSVYDDDLKKYRRVEYSDFAILCDRGKNFPLFKQVFEYLGIPLAVKKDESIVGSYNMMIFKNILKFIIMCKEKNYNEEFKYLYTSLSRSFLYRLTDEEIFKTIKENKIFKSSVYLDALNLSKDIEMMSNQEIVTKVVDDYKFYELANTIGDIDDLERELNFLFNLANSFSNISEFVSFIDDVINYHEELKYLTNIPDSSAVSLMNIHKSKGLEFPICYFIGLYSEFNFQETKNSFLYDKKIGIIAPLKVDTLTDSFLKDLYLKNYYNEEISERIRLFYVALTRAKEKIIFLDQIPEENEVEITDSYRAQYKSFHSILDSVFSKIGVTKIDLKDSDIEFSRDYKFKKSFITSSIEDDTSSTETEEVCEVSGLSNEKESKKTRFSKTTYKLDEKSTKEKKQLGVKVHQVLETLDFNNVDYESIEDDLVKKIVKRMFTQPIFNKKYLNVYKEYQFIDNDTLGIIDLMLEDENSVVIVDYKLKNIDDEHYITQLEGYKSFLVKHTTKVVKAYLYSLIDGELKEI